MGNTYIMYKVLLWENVKKYSIIFQSNPNEWRCQISWLWNVSEVSPRDKGIITLHCQLLVHLEVELMKLISKFARYNCLG